MRVCRGDIVLPNSVEVAQSKFYWQYLVNEANFQDHLQDYGVKLLYKVTSLKQHLFALAYGTYLVILVISTARLLPLHHAATRKA